MTEPPPDSVATKAGGDDGATVDSHDASSSSGAADEWSYRGKRILAPMVRVNTLPFRLLATEHGADIVYSEELVDRSVMRCRRVVNDTTGAIEFRHHDDQRKLIFSTVPEERVVFQIGSACAADALRAAQVVARDVRAVDLNMGCPVKFSTAGGMGSALLTEPEKVRIYYTA
jgi:tRNA-dihydrouridine synthase 2